MEACMWEPTIIENMIHTHELASEAEQVELLARNVEFSLVEEEIRLSLVVPIGDGGTKTRWESCRGLLFGR